MNEQDKTVGEIGEFQLISRLANISESGSRPAVIGDDAAVLERRGDDYLLATVDMLIENVHFVMKDLDAFVLGKKALMASISDIAAMGGVPHHALVSLAIPKSIPASFLEDLYRGLREQGDAVDVAVVGGNMTGTAGPLVIDVTVLGAAPKDQVVRRSGAYVGNILAVTGTLGSASASRQLLSLSDETVPADLLSWAHQHEVPGSRVQSGRDLATAHLATAMIDISDGLSGDIRHLAQASQVGAVIESDRLPISVQVREAARLLKLDVESLALQGGEDYELLVTIAPDKFRDAQNAVGRVGLTAIGSIVPGKEGVTVIRGDRRLPLIEQGWTHF